MKLSTKLAGALIASQATLFTAGAQAGVVYSNDFESSDTANWNVSSIATAPNSEKFLGEFGNQTTTLNLTGLGAHTSVAVAFDLYIIRSWDGNGQYCCGPDQFSFSADGTQYFSETFSNTENAGNIGSFSNSTNATKTGDNSLGYSAWGDSTYRFEFDLAHVADYLTLDFSASGLQALYDESWGLDNIVVSTNATNVSEPGTLALLGLGLAGLGLSRRKSRQG